MIYDTSSSLYKSFLKKLLWQSLAVNILQRRHGDAFKKPTWFACILKSKVAVSCLTEILTRYAGRRQIGLLAGLPFTAKELTAVGKVFLRHFLNLRKVFLTGGPSGCNDCDYPLWNYCFSLLKEASGLGKSYMRIKPSTGLFSKNGPRMVSSRMAGTPNSVSLRTMEYFPDSIGHLRNLSPALLRKPISGKACWWCNRETDTKLKKCSVCYIAYYCSRQCQKEAWPGHETDCKILQAWSRKMVKACRQPGDSHATTIEDALVQRWKSQMLSHVKLLRLDLGLQILEQGNTRTPTEDDFKVFGDVRNKGKGLQSVEQCNTKTPTEEVFQVFGDVMNKHKCSGKNA